MTERQKGPGEYLKKPQRVKLNWYASKNYLAGYISDLPGGFTLEGLIFDLGHSGRGSDDFGEDIEIQCNKAKFTEDASRKGQKMIAVMKLEVFLSIVAKKINKYHRAKELFGRDLDTLNSLVQSEQVKKLVDISFGRPSLNGYRDIESIQDHVE